MSLLRKLKQRRQRRSLRVRSHVQSNISIPRVSVFRSLSHIYGQVIDDISGTTLASCSSLELKNLKGDKKDVARAVGVELAKRSLTKGINRARLDRGRFLYHGRIKALADGLREGGLAI